MFSIHARFSIMSHKFWVLYYIVNVCWKLIWRAITHDLSKFGEGEWPIFSQYTRKLKHIEYLSKEYKDNLRKMKPALDHHYEFNDHHPEHETKFFERASFLQLIEMLCDWKAATRKISKGKIIESISAGRTRWGYDGKMEAMLLRTAGELGMADLYDSLRYYRAKTEEEEGEKTDG